MAPLLLLFVLVLLLEPLAGQQYNYYPDLTRLIRSPESLQPVSAISTSPIGFLLAPGNVGAYYFDPSSGTLRSVSQQSPSLPSSVPSSAAAYPATLPPLEQLPSISNFQRDQPPPQYLARSSAPYYPPSSPNAPLIVSRSAPFSTGPFPSAQYPPRYRHYPSSLVASSNTSPFAGAQGPYEPPALPVSAPAQLGPQQQQNFGPQSSQSQIYVPASSSYNSGAGSTGSNQGSNQGSSLDATSGSLSFAPSSPPFSVSFGKSQQQAEPFAQTLSFNKDLPPYLPPVDPDRQEKLYERPEKLYEKIFFERKTTTTTTTAKPGVNEISWRLPSGEAVEQERKKSFIELLPAGLVAKVATKIASKLPPPTIKFSISKSAVSKVRRAPQRHRAVIENRYKNLA